MKSHYSLARRTAVAVLCVAALTLAGCGQKGPLYLPKVPPDPFVQTKPKPAAPAQDGATDPAKQGATAQPAQQ
ncbi:lipoprotein [Herbaspirillum sp. NPDC087042]|uniref:LPS translocon maturation chaperone LptM n=1 Tax=Herbaspirillum sp. NPDC087042 TaxID=3364004 RepID=UPI0038307CB2